MRDSKNERGGEWVREGSIKGKEPEWLSSWIGAKRQTSYAGILVAKSKITANRESSLLVISGKKWIWFRPVGLSMRIELVQGSRVDVVLQKLQNHFDEDYAHRHKYRMAISNKQKLLENQSIFDEFRFSLHNHAMENFASKIFKRVKYLTQKKMCMSL